MEKDVDREAATIEPTPGTDKLLAYGKYYVNVP